ncbi:MAG: hypothetical protein JXL67_07675, partial [Calditrichaeota bacterium]|nr:hypothetical protein [Calditrichota bacterium]
LEISSSLRVSHLIKWDKHTIWFRTSLPALSLPSDYFSAVAYMLFSRLLKKPVAEKIRQKILQYENQLKTGKSYFPARRLPYGAHKGRYIDLAAIFNEINRSYFNDELKRPTLAWSRKKGKRRLGFYDGLHHRIIINPLLDNPDIPGFVIRGIVYHEILHIIHPVVNKNGRRIIHSPIFKNDERKFADHLKLERWLKEDFPKLLRNRKQTGKIC